MYCQIIPFFFFFFLFPCNAPEKVKKALNLPTLVSHHWHIWRMINCAPGVYVMFYSGQNAFKNLSKNYNYEWGQRPITVNWFSVFLIWVPANNWKMESWRAFCTSKQNAATFQDKFYLLWTFLSSKNQWIY